MDPLTVLVGVGKFYAAPVGTSFPDVDETPDASWVDLGETQDGVTVTFGQSIEEIRVDQETGPVKATRTEENCTIETKLAKATLENLSKLLGQTLNDVPAATGEPGTRRVGLYRGAAVSEYALLYRGESPYGASYTAQYEVPRAYFGGDVEIAHTKDGNVAFTCEAHALVDPNATSDAEKFGRLVVQDDDAD